MKKTIRIIGFKLPANNAGYYKKQLQIFANHTSDNITTVEFGKQDERGGHSICFFNDKGDSLSQIQMASKEHLLGYVVGYNEARQPFDLMGIMV